LFHKDKAHNAIKYGNIDYPFQATIVKYEEESKPVIIKLQYAAINVCLPAITGDLTMLIVKGFGNVPMFLLTNLPLNLNAKNQV